MTKSLVKNAADETQVKEAEVKEKYGRDRDLDDIDFVLSTHKGRRFFWRMLSVCGVFKLSFVNDPYGTAFNEGARSVGNQFLADAMDEINLQKYFQMANEARQENR